MSQSYNIIKAYKTCPWCGIDFCPKGKQVYCSPQCGYKYRRLREKMEIKKEIAALWG